MARKLTREVLLPALRALETTPKGSPLDVPAIEFALALWESGGQLGALGDVAIPGGSLGLWQVNQRAWAKKIGAYDPARVADGVPTADALGYEVAYVRPVIGDMLRAVLRGIETIAGRVRAGETGFVFSPIRDLPIWASFVWQYGAPAFQRWVMASKDLSADGWKTWRTSAGLRTEPDHAKRQAFIAGTYLQSLASPPAMLATLRAISVKTGVDFWSEAAKTLKVAKTEIEAWAAATAGKLAKGIKPGKASLGIALLSAGALYLHATQEGEKGRELRPEYKQELVTIGGGIALALLAKGGLG